MSPIEGAFHPCCEQYKHGSTVPSAGNGPGSSVKLSLSATAVSLGSVACTLITLHPRRDIMFSRRRTMKVTGFWVVAPCSLVEIDSPP
jgi:hypothetical protein